MRHTPVYILIAIIAIVVVGLGLATAMVVSSHGYFLDPDGRAHVQTLTGLNYGIPEQSPTVLHKPTAQPTTTPSPTPVPVLTTSQLVAIAFCNGQTASCTLSKQAEKVAMCMSGEMPGHTTATGGMGLFGLRAATWAMSPYAKLNPLDAATNAKAAHWLYQTSGNSWVRWGSCG